MHRESGVRMFLRAEEPMDGSPRGMPLYLCTPDLIALREQLLAAGVDVPPFNHPDYMRGGEVCIAE